MTDVESLYGQLGGESMFGSIGGSGGGSTGGSTATSIIGGVLSAATTIASGIMQTSATTAASSQAKQLEEKRMETEEKSSKRQDRLARAGLGLERRRQEMQQQQYWVSRADALKQLDKQSFDNFANRLTDRASKDFTFKQALFTLW